MKKMILFAMILLFSGNVFAETSPGDFAVGQVWYMPGLVVDGARPPVLPYQYGEVKHEFKGTSYRYCIETGRAWTFFQIQSYPGNLMLHYHIDLGTTCDHGKTYHHRWTYWFGEAESQAIVDSDGDGLLDDKDPFPYDKKIPNDGELGLPKSDDICPLK